MLNCSTRPAGTPSTTFDSGEGTYCGPMRKLPSIFAGGLAPAGASVGLEAASASDGARFAAAFARSSAPGPATTRAGVPGAVGGRVGGGAAWDVAGTRDRAAM